MEPSKVLEMTELERRVQDTWWRSKTARELDPLGTIGPFKAGTIVPLPKPKSRALMVVPQLPCLYPGGIDDLLG
jgi:hypothetical protein